MPVWTQPANPFNPNPSPDSTMRSPLMTLAWEIWRQSRRSFWLVAGIILFASLVNHIIPERIRAIEAYREPLEGMNGLLMVLSLGFIFGIFNYTESDRRKDWSGFPYRLFV